MVFETFRGRTILAINFYGLIAKCSRFAGASFDDAKWCVKIWVNSAGPSSKFVCACFGRHGFFVETGLIWFVGSSIADIWLKHLTVSLSLEFL